MKSNNTLQIIFLAILLVGTTTLSAQDQGFIYGKVTTIDDRVYEGPLRWGKEEVYWTDMFNAGKYDNNNLQYLSREERRKLEDRYHHNNHGSWFAAWINDHDDDNDRHAHQFVCQFGELKSIRPFSRNRIDVVLQNGDKIEVNGDGYNDIGTDVQIYDQEIGQIKIDWGRISSIEFMKTPGTLSRKFGEPLYGTVSTYNGTFTGTIQWDHDERVSTDLLDGDTRDGDVSIEFGNIASIERDGYNASIVVLKSGRKMELDDSNDVDSGNRGIIVTTDFGRVDIPWEEFKKVDFTNKAPFKLEAYDDFKSQKPLSGVVKSRKGEFKGRIIFDLDEEMDYEVLQGKIDDIEYIIPFKSIKRIAPKNYEFSTVELTNGKSLLLGEGQDVSDKNTGVLVFKNEDNPVYLEWEEIDEIVFQ